MPNWAYNTLTIKGNKNRLIEIRETVKGNQNRSDDEIEDFDFYKIKEDGNFGVKWNACEVETYDNLDSETETPEYQLDYNFNTAWTWPQPVIEELCKKYPDVDIDYICTEESYDFAIHGWNNKGELVYNKIDSSEMFSDDNKWHYIDTYFEQHSDLNKDDYDLDSFFNALEESELVWEVEDYGFDYTIEKNDDNEVRNENDFIELIIRPYDDDTFEELLQEYKN